jgi:hypothetical protein
MSHPVGENSTLNVNTTSLEDPKEAPGASGSDREELVGKQSVLWQIMLWAAFVVGIGSGYLLWGRNPSSVANRSNGQTEIVSQQRNLEGLADAMREINPPKGYKLPAFFGDIGPQLLKAGAIDYPSFEQTYKRAGQPLTAQQQSILQNGGDYQITIDKENAYFLLNLFWALGLTNHNPILTEGPMIQNGAEQVGRFASTGGWTLGTKHATKLYASEKIISLTAEQQSRIEEVASNVYRPCCNNPTSFPDCNHGMAMLGLVELMASQGASAEEMFEAAKYVNAFWFPQQTLELVAYYESTQGLDFSEIDARQIVGPRFSSASGFNAAHQWLVENGLLEGTPGEGSNCGV